EIREISVMSRTLLQVFLIRLKIVDPRRGVAASAGEHHRGSLRWQAATLVVGGGQNLPCPPWAGRREKKGQPKLPFSDLVPRRRALTAWRSSSGEWPSSSWPSSGLPFSWPLSSSRLSSWLPFSWPPSSWWPSSWSPFGLPSSSSLSSWSPFELP